ncbi:MULTISPECIES: hypothetical protein [unclassified Rhizobium]|uniref:hypothetical protein n=1 Tax=unclassified Rhizobium TaxID=2613769 RepID=UPI001787273A|nr:MULTISPECIES: hypothetical protein [unclassified Rhizobium]MBD8686968.1 hypothetical protein [Rhizobium sp. CFBP 13644]MBD8691229.1 hypothetical protein [Rhizobium sp. CFBP 13717]
MRFLLTAQMKLLYAAVATVGVSLALVLTFQGWMRHGTDIFLAAVQSGVAWCF